MKKDADQSRKRTSGTKGKEAPKKKIDWDAIRVLVEKGKAEGKSPDEITSAVRAKFGDEVGAWPFVPIPRT